MNIEKINEICIEIYGKLAGDFEYRFVEAIEQAARATAEPRDSVIEQCALIVEQHQETFTTMSGGDDERHLTKRRHGNQMGMAYANAIRTLKSQQDAAIEAQRSGDGS